MEIGINIGNRFELGEKFGTPQMTFACARMEFALGIIRNIRNLTNVKCLQDGIGLEFIYQNSHSIKGNCFIG